MVYGAEAAPEGMVVELCVGGLSALGLEWVGLLHSFS